MLHLRVREYSPAGVRGRILPVVEGTLTWTVSENSTPTLVFALANTVAERMPDDGFAVGVEYSVNGGRFQPVPYHDRFIMNQNDGDDSDPTKTVIFTGESLALWKLARTYVHWASNSVDKIRKISRLPNGHFDYFFKESKARGWGLDITFPYTNGVDSAGTTWPVGDSVELEWRLGTPLTDVLTTLTDGGLCDWNVVGTEFRMYVPGTYGEDRTELLLSSAQVTRSPIKSDVSGLISHISVMSDTGYWQYLSTPETKWGKLEATMSMSGVGDFAVASKMAQPALDEGSKAKREEAYEWDTAALTLTPLKDFNIGDTLTVSVRGGRVARKVIGFVIREEGTSTIARAILGESISSQQKKILSRVTSATVGGIIGGTGAGFPASIGPSPLSPDKPNGLMVVSNTATWRKDGTAQSTVELSWSPVTQAADGSEIAVERYEVWSRLPHENAARVTSVTSPTATVSSWPPGVLRLVHVVAISDKGVRSEPSLELTVTPVMPTSVVPKPPQNLTAVSNVGAFTVAGPVATVTLSWDAVTESNDDEPIEIAEYHVWVDGMPAVVVKGVTAKLQLPSGLTSEYRVLAVSELRFASDLSAPINVTGAQPVLVSRDPSAPILTTGYGNAFARWDGTYLTGGAGAHSVWAEARLDAGDPWERQGAALTGAGSTMLDIGAVGDEVFVRLVAYDQLMRETGASVVESVVITAIDGDDILADSIDANRIKAGTIEVDRLSPNVGDTLNLTANNAIVMLVDGHDSLASDIAGVGDAAAAAQTAADQADAAAQDAASQAAIAAGAALVAQSQAEYASTAVEDLAAVFVVTATGAEVRSKDASNVFAISPTGAAIVQGGVNVSTWDGTKFISSQIITNSVSFGSNHIAETSSARTVFRAL